MLELEEEANSYAAEGGRIDEGDASRFASMVDPRSNVSGAPNDPARDI